VICSDGLDQTVDGGDGLENFASETREDMAQSSLISVVDDDRSMGRMLARIIGAAGLRVEVFTSAEEFLDSARLNDSTCLVLDVDLPGMSGLELQQRLNNSGQEIPIIFISGQATEHIRERALKAGALGFFDKPFSIASLLNTIQSA
jgi:FixJ family two-component response regulator